MYADAISDFSRAAYLRPAAKK